LSLDHSGTDPRVVYVSGDFLGAFGYVHPDQFGSDGVWQAVEESKWASLGNRQALEDFLEARAQRLLAASTECLADFFSTNRKLYIAEAEERADLALSASCDPHLRDRIYLRYGAALLYSQLPERVRNLYEFAFRPEHPALSFESFLEEVKNFSTLLRRVYPLDRLKGELDSGEMVQEIRDLETIQDPEVLELQCQRFASAYPLSAEQPVLKKLIDLGLRNALLSLDEADAKLLAREAFFFKSGSLTSKQGGGARPFNFHVVQFLVAMRDQDRVEILPGRIAQTLFLGLEAGRRFV
jgi:hypothetical protein